MSIIAVSSTHGLGFSLSASASRLSRSMDLWLSAGILRDRKAFVHLRLELVNDCRACKPDMTKAWDHVCELPVIETGKNVGLDVVQLGTAEVVAQDISRVGKVVETGYRFIVPLR